MIRKIYIDPKILDMSLGIRYTKPTFRERIKMFFGWEFEPKKIQSKSFMDVIPKVPHPKFISKIGSVVTS